MKNLKKVFALLVVFTMVLSTVAFASPFDDVKDDANYAEAVTTLSSLGLFKGDDKGNFNPDKSITRAEFSAVLVRTMGMGDPGQTATAFNDVPATHWGSGYIQAATQMGVLAGYGDGNFGPDDPVTYEQAIKMIVAALGYTPEAETRGGYPTGYMMIAAREGITAGANGKVGEQAVRATVAQLLYNALDVPLMVQTGFGTQISYEVMDGKNDRDFQTILTSKLDVTKIEGILTDNKFGKDDDRVEILITEVNGKDIEYYDENIEDIRYKRPLIYVGNTNAKDLLGYYVVAYVNEFDTSDATLFSIAPKAGENNIITIIDMENIVVDADGDVITPDKSGRNRIFKYWIDKDDKKPQEVKISQDDPSTTNINEDFRVYRNGLYLGDEDELEVPALGGKIVLLDNNDDDYYEYCFVTEYQFYVVEEVDEDGDVTTQNGDTLSFDPDDDEIVYNIYLDGEKIEPKDLEPWDVLSVVEAEGDDFTVQTVYVTRDSITGVVTEDLSDDDEGTKEYVIDGQTVKFNPVVTDNIKLGNEYTFYLNVDGQVVWVEKGNTTSKARENYAYLYNADYETGITNYFEVELFTAEGKWVVYRTAEKFDVNDVRYNCSDNTYVTDLFEFEGGSLKPSCRQIVTYRLDSEGRIKEINSSLKAAANNEDFVSIDSPFSNRNYRASDDKLGSYYIGQDTVIFSYDSSQPNNKDKYGVVTAKAFTDGKEYMVEFYDIDSNTKEPGAILADGVTGNITDDSDFFVVSSVAMTKDDDDEDVYKFTGYVRGEEKEIIVSEDVYVTQLGSIRAGVYGDIKVEFDQNNPKKTYITGLKYSVIQYSVNASDEVDKIRVVYKNGLYPDNTHFAAYIEDDKSDLRVLYGTVADKLSRGRIEIRGEEAVSVANAKFIELDFSTGSKPRIRTKVGLSDIDKGESIVLVREYDGFVEDVVIITE